MDCSRFEEESSGSFILCIIMDLTFPTDGALCKKCMEALENVLAWALFAPHQVSLVGVTSINSSPQHKLQFTHLGGNLSVLSSLLRGVFRTAGDSNIHMAPGDLKDSLFFTINNVVLHLKEKRGLRAAQIISTVVTCRDGQPLCDWLDGLRDEVARYFDAMQVVQLSTEPSTRPRFSASGSAREGRPVVRLAVVPVDAAGVERAEGAAQGRLEAALRSAWFTPRASELLPLELELSCRPTPAVTMLRCVASRCVLDPGSLPVGDHFVLLAGGGAGGGTRGAAKEPRVLRVLRAVTRVCADGVCEGSLFGQPLRVTWSPPSAFQSHDDFQHNAHLFLALCESLADKDEQLVVKLQTGAQPTAASGHFILMPGDECMLLRAIASAELGLPPPPPPPMQYDGNLAARAEQQVCGALDALPVEEQYRAKDFPSGLCAALRLAAGFPERLSVHRERNAASTPSKAFSPSSSVTFSPPRASSPPPLSPAPAPPPVWVDDEDVIKLSSDEDELPEVNVRTLALSGSSSKSAPPPSHKGHKLGTGGHPALQDDFGAAPSWPSKRKKFQPLHGVFKTRRN